MHTIEEFLRLHKLYWCTQYMRNHYVCTLTRNLTSWGL